ncbi:MAG: hypothetical protein KBC16_03455 [Candidatus Pacebacteria bacterium]|nr:hypothetical protein [Candidatus Paceibacterota bacterium]
MPTLDGFLLAKFLAFGLFLHGGYRLWVSVRFGKHLRNNREGKRIFLLDSHTSNRYCYLANVAIAATLIVMMRETSDAPRAGALFLVHSCFLFVWSASLVGAYIGNGIRWPGIHKYFGYTHVISYALILVTGSIMLWRL